MTQRLLARIREHKSETAEGARFAHRLLAAVAAVERQFEGAERERLLALLGETFERHQRLARRAASARAELHRLRLEQRRLRRVVDFLVESPVPKQMH